MVDCNVKATTADFLNKKKYLHLLCHFELLLSCCHCTISAVYSMNSVKHVWMDNPDDLLYLPTYAVYEKEHTAQNIVSHIVLNLTFCLKHDTLIGSNNHNFKRFFSFLACFWTGHKFWIKNRKPNIYSTLYRLLRRIQ